MKFNHILCALLVAATWGFNFIVVKTGLSEMPPFLYASCRFAIASLPLLLFIEKPPLPWRLIIGIGLCSGVAKFGLLFLGIHLGMSGGLASLIFQSQALFTTVLSVILLGDRIRANQVWGMFIALVGMTLIGLNLHEGATLTGFFLILCSAISWGFSNILFKKAGRVNMFAMIVWTSAIPVIPLYIISCIFEGPGALPDMLSNMTLLGWECLLYTAFASTWVGSTLWAVLLRNYDASIVAPYSLLVPIFGLTFGHLLLGEQFSLATYGACGLVFLGLVVNQWRTRLREAPASGKEIESSPLLPDTFKKSLSGGN